MDEHTRVNCKDYDCYRKHLGNEERKYAPKELFWMGNFSLLNESVKVAVVGSRKASILGQKRAVRVTQELVRNGITVVSGLAEGIDTIAHETAIKNSGNTIAVLGTSLKDVYPKNNYQLLETIKANHLAVSQFAEDYPTQRKNFPMRNKTMALLSDATIIIEASENSGTKHQGWEALRLGRVLFILQNIVENSDLTWPKEMIKYGAQVLTAENMKNLFTKIPNFSPHPCFEFAD